MKKVVNSVKINRAAFVLAIVAIVFSCSKSELTQQQTGEVGDPKNPPVQTTPDSNTTNTTPVENPEIDIPPVYDRSTVSIKDNQFLINGRLTYEGRVWQGNKIEGLLFNSRMVQGVFDDLNPQTLQIFAYPDTNKWDPERNTNEFIAAMSEWKSNGLLAFTLNMQGGSPTGYGNQKPWATSAFDEKGELIPDYSNRLKRILDKADELQMVVILGYFYFGQDQLFESESAIVHAVDTMTDWILENDYRNVIVEINNECNNYYDHAILQPDRVHELINRVKAKQKDGFRLLVSTSFTGGFVPSANVVQVSDFILLHGNGIGDPSGMTNLIAATKNVPGYILQPIVINEDDHYDFESPSNNMVSAIQSYASWGYFDFRKQGEGFESGFQSVPVDWGINSDRKRSFFSTLKEITGY